MKIRNLSILISIIAIVISIKSLYISHQLLRFEIDDHSYKSNCQIDEVYFLQKDYSAVSSMGIVVVDNDAESYLDCCVTFINTGGKTIYIDKFYGKLANGDKSFSVESISDLEIPPGKRLIKYTQSKYLKMVLLNFFM